MVLVTFISPRSMRWNNRLLFLLLLFLLLPPHTLGLFLSAVFDFLPLAALPTGFVFVFGFEVYSPADGSSTPSTISFGKSSISGVETACFLKSDVNMVRRQQGGSRSETDAQVIHFFAPWSTVALQDYSVIMADKNVAPC